MVENGEKQRLLVASSSSIVVEHLTKGANFNIQIRLILEPKDKIPEKNVLVLDANSSSKVGKLSTHAYRFEGLNPTDAGTKREKMSGKISSQQQ